MADRAAACGTAADETVAGGTAVWWTGRPRVGRPRAGRTRTSRSLTSAAYGTAADATDGTAANSTAEVAAVVASVANEVSTAEVAAKVVAVVASGQRGLDCGGVRPRAASTADKVADEAASVADEVGGAISSASGGVRGGRHRGPGRGRRYKWLRPRWRPAAARQHPQQTWSRPAAVNEVTTETHLVCPRQRPRRPRSRPRSGGQGRGGRGCGRLGRDIVRGGRGWSHEIGAATLSARGGVHGGRGRGRGDQGRGRGRAGKVAADEVAAEASDRGRTTSRPRRCPRWTGLGLRQHPQLAVDEVAAEAAGRGERGLGRGVCGGRGQCCDLVRLRGCLRRLRSRPRRCPQTMDRPLPPVAVGRRSPRWCARTGGGRRSSH